jgi:hypothetical protein
MNDMKHYTLNLDGPAFRAQRELLLRIADLVRQKRSYTPVPGDEGLLEGLLNLTDAIADQAHDRHGIDCLLPDGDEDDAQDTGLPGHCKTVRVPVEITFTTDPAELDDRQGESVPTKESLLAYLQDALVLEVDTEGNGQPKGAAFAAIGIDWDAATLTGHQDTSR